MLASSRCAMGRAQNPRRSLYRIAPFFCIGRKRPPSFQGDSAATPGWASWSSNERPAPKAGSGCTHQAQLALLRAD